MCNSKTEKMYERPYFCALESRALPAGGVAPVSRATVLSHQRGRDHRLNFTSEKLYLDQIGHFEPLLTSELTFDLGKTFIVTATAFNPNKEMLKFCVIRSNGGISHYLRNSLI